jgi:dihydrofolate synthase / folylpolyglutamate synthase
VLEVGLGGRLDATNVISPVVAAIVSIDFDHQAQLGHTIEQIAREKAGIVKAGIPVVCGALPSEALAVVAQVCRDRGATLIRADTDASLAARIRAMPLALKGAHQARNAAVAVKVLQALDDAGIRVDQRAIDEGLTRTVWPARLEEFEADGSRVIVDAAHNPAGARALADYIAAELPDGVTLVFGAMRDKAIDEMLAALSRIARHTICTTAPSPRALDADTLAARALGAGHVRVEAAADPDEALTRALATHRPVVIAGSIFLAGPLRERLARGILR